MENFKEALIRFAHSNPSLFPDDAGNSYPMLIEQCFHQFFPDFQSPNHPPYAAMIYRAILELNKKGGSSEKSISKFIKKEYADLPWAHSTLLKHHLEKLCDRKEICMTYKQCYLLAGAESESGKKSSGPSKTRKKQKNRSDSQAIKKSSRLHKKCKKKEKSRLDVQETSDKEQRGMHKRKRKRVLKPKRKSIKRVKKHEINEDSKLELLNEANLKQNNEVTDDESHDQKQTLQVKMGDIQNLEQNELCQESHHDNSDYINLKQIQTKKNPKLLQPVKSPDSNPKLLKIGKRVGTRSRSKKVSKKNALSANSELRDSPGYANRPKDKLDIVEHLSNEKQQAMEIIKVKSAVDAEPQQISRRPSLDKPLIELLTPISSKLIPRFPDDEPTTGPASTEVQDPFTSPQPEKSPLEDKPEFKRHSRNLKRSEPEKDDVLCNSKTRKRQKSAKKSKTGNKKVQPKHKPHGRHKKTRRSSTNPSC